MMLEYNTDMDQLMALKRGARANASSALFKYLDVNIFPSLFIIIHLL
jgi:hypothetical protein